MRVPAFSCGARGRCVARCCFERNFLLQGSCIEWLGCALYVAGQSTFQETVEGGHSSGNKVSLTQILRATKLR